MINIKNIKENTTTNDNLIKIGRLEMVAELIEDFKSKRSRKEALSDLKRKANRELLEHRVGVTINQDIVF